MTKYHTTIVTYNIEMLYNEINNKSLKAVSDLAIDIRRLKGSLAIYCIVCGVLIRFQNYSTNVYILYKVLFK